MKIIFMGTPEFAVPSLEALYENEYNIKLVITQRDRPKGRGKKVQYPPIKEKAIELGIEVYQPEDINSQESVELIKSIRPDFIIVAAFGQILKKELLEIPKYGCINVHASLLPKYRGAAPINWAIINGEKETGITIMEMSEGLDSGDMIKKKSIKISDTDDYISLHDQLSNTGADLLIESMREIIEGRSLKTPQDHSKSTYAPMIYRDTGKINWNKSSQEIYNLTKGLRPWPGTYTSYKDEIVKIHVVELLYETREGKPGEIIEVSSDGILVNTLDSTIIIKELQFPNKRRMKVSEYLAGNSIEPGIILE